ncbi:SDR family oxidoreductase [Halomarina pelagica]|uniref:SDR family oxidoreductase n=1 Tax=Halomarina pelagica TaxID=2961599 RepID=UPI0020C23C1E|nr:SDR family oxidoreductase [Halomarina sp. BND7]
MPGLLTDRAAVVTGGSSGNGRAIATRFAEEGADVVVADVQADPREGGDPTHEIIESETDRSATFVECDVTDRASLDAAVDAADDFGGIDVMVNNAGILGPVAEIGEIDYEGYRQLMDVNLDGVYFGAQAAARRMKERGEGGSIVNMSSVAGIVGYPEITPYSAAKGGVRLLTYALAGELGQYDIRVNVIHPGVIETAMTTEDMPMIGTQEGEAIRETLPIQRYGTPEDVANAAVFLASDLASYVTAESILVDGGMVNTA